MQIWNKGRKARERGEKTEWDRSNKLTGGGGGGAEKVGGIACEAAALFWREYY